MEDQEQCRLWANLKKQRKTFMQDAKKIAVLGYVKHNDNALKEIAVQWAVEKVILPEGIKCWTEQLQEGG